MIELTRVKNDQNGNPRYVIHFMCMLKPETKITDLGGVLNAWEAACKAANKIGGRKYRGKEIGGGIVFQRYNTRNLIERIKEARI